MAWKHFLIKKTRWKSKLNLQIKNYFSTKVLIFQNLPGVYKFFNSEHEILYIGKAKNIKNRVKTYLNVEKEMEKEYPNLSRQLNLLRLLSQKLKLTL